MLLSGLQYIIWLFIIVQVLAGGKDKPDSPPAHPSLPGLTRSCREPRVRREWREISKRRQQQFFNGVLLMKKAPSKLGQASLYDDLVHIHWKMNSEGHNRAVFLPWHRVFVQIFENNMRTVLNDTTYNLPYWQWTVDSQAPERSPLLQSDAFGTMGDSSTHCVYNGYFAKFRKTVPNRECLKRSGQLTVGSFYSPELMRKLIKHTKYYKDFRRDFENHAHANVGIELFTLVAKHFSPNDPIFWVHHTQVDRLWYEWQKLDKRRLSTEYHGDLYELINPFGVKVKDTMDPLASRAFCYTYTPGIIPIKAGHRPTNLFRTQHPENGTLVPPQYFQQLTVSPHDRSNPYLLRVPEPISLEWITLHRMNETEIRLGEARLAQQIQELNRKIAQGEFRSPAALENLDQGMKFRSLEHFWEE